MENIREIMEAAVSEYGANKAFTLKLGDGEYRDISYSRYYEEIDVLERRCYVEASRILESLSSARIATTGISPIWQLC